jgi:hypothetical protein
VNKPRLTWNYPLHAAYEEARFSRPFLEWFSDYPYFAWDCGYLSGGHAKISSALFGTRYQQFFSTEFDLEISLSGVDLSAFDFQAEVVNIVNAFKVIRSLFKLNEVNRIRFSRFKNYFVHTPIYLGNKLYLSHGMVPSGSPFTQIIDTILNLFYTTVVSIILMCFQQPLNTYTVDCFVKKIKMLEQCFARAVFLGDDSIVRWWILIRKKKYLVWAYATLGQKVHPEKGFFFGSFGPYTDYDDPDEGHSCLEFLGKYVDRSCVYTPWNLVKAQMSIPEDPDVCPGDALTRIIGVTYSAGTDWNVYSNCLKMFEDVKSRYPYAEPTPFKKDFENLWRYVEFKSLDDLPELTFPTFERIQSLYNL